MLPYPPRLKISLAVWLRSCCAFPCPEHGAGLVQIGALDKRLTATRGRNAFLRQLIPPSASAHINPNLLLYVPLVILLPENLYSLGAWCACVREATTVRSPPCDDGSVASAFSPYLNNKSTAAKITF